MPEGGGTMLDHTLVVRVNELGRGNSHTLRNVPFVLAGNVPNDAGVGQFRTGRHLAHDGDQRHDDLWTSAAQAFGMADVTRWGDARYSNGPLPRLT